MRHSPFSPAEHDALTAASLAPCTCCDAPHRLTQADIDRGVPVCLDCAAELVIQAMILAATDDAPFIDPEERRPLSGNIGKKPYEDGSEE